MDLLLLSLVTLLFGLSAMLVDGIDRLMQRSTIMVLISGILALILLIYLFVALLKPEKFG